MADEDLMKDLEAQHAADQVDAETSQAAKSLVLDLLAVDAKAKAQGHSLVELIVAVGQSRFGIDVRPDPVKPDDAQ